MKEIFRKSKFWTAKIVKNTLHKIYAQNFFHHAYMENLQINRDRSFIALVLSVAFI